MVCLVSCFVSFEFEYCATALLPLFCFCCLLVAGYRFDSPPTLASPTPGVVASALFALTELHFHWYACLVY